jgi:hypothetical protein
MRWTRRALRPRSVDCSVLMASSSSSTSTGMARLFSWNLKIDWGSWIRTFVSNTNVLTLAVTLIRDLEAGASRRFSIKVGWEYPVSK